MVAVPPATPYTVPVDALTVATEALLLVQVPPEAVLANTVVLPGHTVAVPVMAAGVALTVTTVPTAPQEVVYEMVAVPALTALTIPLDEPTVATLVLRLVQLPPGGASVSASGLFEVVSVMLSREQSLPY